MLNEWRGSDIGLGTTYERWALTRLLAALPARLGITTVLEGPGDGMAGIAGINSIPLARAGARVTVALNDEEQVALARRAWERYGGPGPVHFQIAPAHGLGAVAEPFDLVWNFGVMPYLPDPSATLRQMLAVTGRFVLLFLPNPANYTFRLRLRRLEESADGGVAAWMSRQRWESEFARQGLVVREVMTVDCPWWPDVIDISQAIHEWFPFLPQRMKWLRPETRCEWTVDDLPYFDAGRYSDLHRRMARLAWIEDSRWQGLRLLFAHHIGILAEKTQALTVRDLGDHGP